MYMCMCAHGGVYTHMKMQVQGHMGTATDRGLLIERDGHRGEFFPLKSKH
jgi:hypothetical protein